MGEQMKLYKYWQEREVAGLIFQIEVGDIQIRTSVQLKDNPKHCWMAFADILDLKLFDTEDWWELQGELDEYGWWRWGGSGILKDFRGYDVTELCIY